MDALAILRRTIRESGIQAATPSSFENQTGRTLDAVNAVITAYDRIQERNSSWRWLRTEFTTTVSAITPPTEARYTAASFGLTRFSDWVNDYPPKSFYPMSIYLTATGLSDESRLQQIPFYIWKEKYGRGVQTTSKPTEWSIDNLNRFCLGKFPDGPYTIKGEYRKGRQTLALSADTPEMPDQFHMSIVWLATVMLTEQDEASADTLTRAGGKFDELISQLERDQLPALEINRNPIA